MHEEGGDKGREEEGEQLNDNTAAAVLALCLGGVVIATAVAEERKVERRNWYV